MPGEPNEVNWRGVRPVSGIRGIWPARNAERVYASEYNAGNATVLLYTVPVGKLLFLANAVLGISNDAAVPAVGYISTRDGADVLSEYIAVPKIFTVGQLFGIFSFIPAIEVPAGYDVIFTSNVVSLTGRFIIRGWLEDA